MYAIQTSDLLCKSLTITNLPTPIPNPEQVLITVYAAGVNPMDWKLFQQHNITNTKFTPPFTIGWDVAGVIKEVGKNVTSFKPGDSVYGLVGFPNKSGSYAEYMLANPKDLAIKPKTLDFTQAASIPLAALTAWQALHSLNNLKNKTILIIGASGGVGHFAVQFAKYKLAKVIAIASAKNHDFLYQLGANKCLDYNSEDCYKLIANNSINLIIDTATEHNNFKAIDLLATNGKYINLNHKLLTQPNAKQLDIISNLLDKKIIITQLDHIFTLESVLEAHNLSKTKHVRGKIALFIR